MLRNLVAACAVIQMLSATTLVIAAAAEFGTAEEAKAMLERAVAAVNMVMRSLAIDLAPHGITIWITAQAATRLRNMSSLLKGCSARVQARVIIAPHRHSRKIQWPTGFSICLCYGWP